MEKDMEMIRSICTFLDDRKAEDLVVLDLREATNVADYFIIATGANKPHLKSLYDGLQRLFKDSGFRDDCHRTGSPESGWMIMDYYGVMVHLFDREIRDFYNLEEYWKDARRVELEEGEA